MSSDCQMAGRRPKPTAIKKNEGNPGKRKLSKLEPRPAQGEPDRPKHLVGEAKREWERIVPELLDMGVLTKVDRVALCAYCQCYADWCAAKKEVKKFGRILKAPSGYPVVNPSIGIANTAMREMRAFLIEFGLTPASRTRLKVEKPEDGVDLAKLLSQPRAPRQAVQ